MSLFAKLRKILRAALLGNPELSRAFDLPIQAPQCEVSVWLHGTGAPRDVTTCHSVACSVPFTLCISGEGRAPLNRRAALRFHERGGEKRLLGVIELQHEAVIPTGGPELHLYKAVACTNLCLPRLRHWVRSALVARAYSKDLASGRMAVSLLDNGCNEIFFFCPRPVALVSVQQADRCNIFPMNLMGPVGQGYFVFALNSSKQGGTGSGALVDLALSTIPFEYAEQVRQLGKNHHHHSIDFDQLYFATQPSPTLGIPVPHFALAVRELRVEQTHCLGSHTFFIARILHRHVYQNSPEFHRIHGIYAVYRRKSVVGRVPNFWPQ